MRGTEGTSPSHSTAWQPFKSALNSRSECSLLRSFTPANEPLSRARAAGISGNAARILFSSSQKRAFLSYSLGGYQWERKNTRPTCYLQWCVRSQEKEGGGQNFVLTPELRRRGLRLRDTTSKLAEYQRSILLRLVCYTYV